MSHRTFLAAGLLFAAGFALSPNLSAQDAQRPAADAEAAGAAGATSTPTGPEHKKLAAMEGEYDVVTKMWMDPAMPPMESKGKSAVKMILGGRYLREKFEGDMMGEKFEGLGLTGYDTFKKKFVGTWVDTMSTGITQLEGSLSADGKTMTMQGETFDAMQNQVFTMKIVSSYRDNGGMLSEFYRVEADGKEAKMMEIQYTRSANDSKDKAKDDNKKKAKD